MLELKLDRGAARIGCELQCILHVQCFVRHDRAHRWQSAVRAPADQWHSLKQTAAITFITQICMYVIQAQSLICCSRPDLPCDIALCDSHLRTPPTELLAAGMWSKSRPCMRMCSAAEAANTTSDSATDCMSSGISLISACTSGNSAASASALG